MRNTETPAWGSASAGRAPPVLRPPWGLSSWQMSPRHWAHTWARPGCRHTGEGWHLRRPVCPAHDWDKTPVQQPGPPSVEAAGRAEERQGLGWGRAHALFPGLEGWLRLEYSDTSSPGGLGGGRGLPRTCLGLRPSWAHGAHRLLRATLGSAWGLPSWARSASRSGEGQVPGGHQTQPCRAPCLLRVGLGPHSCPSCSARAHGSYATGKAGIPRAVGLLGRSPGLILLMPLPQAGLQPCQSLCPLPVTRGGGPEGEGAGSPSPHPSLLPVTPSPDHPSLLCPVRSPV